MATLQQFKPHLRVCTALHRIAMLCTARPWTVLYCTPLLETAHILNPNFRAGEEAAVLLPYFLPWLCSAMQCCAVNCSAVQFSTVYFSLLKQSAVQWSLVQCSAVQCSVVRCGEALIFIPWPLSSRSSDLLPLLRPKIAICNLHETGLILAWNKSDPG